MHECAICGLEIEIMSWTGNVVHRDTGEARGYVFRPHFATIKGGKFDPNTVH